MNINPKPYIKYLSSLCFILLLWLPFAKGHAQGSESAQPVRLYAERELKRSAQQNIISTVLKVANSSDSAFEGSLRTIIPEGMKAVSSDVISIRIEAGDSLFVPYKMIVTPALPAGESVVTFMLEDMRQQELQKHQALFKTEDKIVLNLNVEERNILITNANDSVRIAAKVKNNGNSRQSVAVVFSIPTLQRGVNFVERTATVEPMEEKIIVFSFIATTELLNQQNFHINVSGLRGKEKVLFGSSSVSVQNASSHQQYVYNNFEYGLYNPYSKNSFSLNHRFSNYSSTGTTQLLGTGSIDLPAGFVGLSANLYSYGRGRDIVATNTTVAYQLERNEIVAGSIYESLELSMSGRGAAVQVGNKHNNSLKVGFIDQQYNVFSTESMLDNTHSFYALANFGGMGYDRKGQASLIHQYDIYEKARHTVAGGEVNNLFGKRWNGTLKTHAAVSSPFEGGKEQYSGAAEIRYNGNVKGTDVSGNYYYSSPYFPGNRRGATYMQQSVYKRLSRENAFRVGGYYSRYAPQSHALQMNYKNSQVSGDAEYYLPRVENTTVSFGYQFQYERSNSYAMQSGYNKPEHIRSHRAKTAVRWNSENSNHSLMTAYEYGFSGLPENKNEMQMKSSVTYAYKWLNTSINWQEGSFYLSDYYMSKRLNKSYKRIMGSMGLNKNFGIYLQAYAGANLIYDLYNNYSPSLFANIRYAPNQTFSIYTNSSWMKYRYANIPSRTSWNSEVGVTINLNGRKASSGRKSNINLIAFHDTNANGIYDKGEKPAEGYKVKIDNKTFVTNDKGKATYSRVPFGKYNIGRVSERGWFSATDTIDVKKYRTTTYIPLQQAGSVTGQVELIFDAKTSIDTPPSREGIVFIATSEDGNVSQRIYTDKEGRFTIFLPAGEYTIELITGSLHPDLSSDKNIRKFSITPGKISKLSNFQLQVRQKKVNIKRFTQD